MTTITFETSTLADAVRKADRVAPSRSGQAFDKAAGIVMDIFPEGDISCVIRATSLEVFSAEAVSALHVEGEETRWRVSSMAFAKVIAALPIGTGKTVTLKQERSEVKLTSGKTRGALRLMDPTYYPSWESFDPDGMSSITGLGSKLELVEWAASTAPQPPLCGVYLDGEYAMAADRYRMARVPARIDLAHPVTIPAGILSGVLKPMGDVSLALRESLLEVAVDDYHQVQVTVYDMKYPDIRKAMRTEFPETVEVDKGAFLGMINLANTFSGADRNPVMKLYFGREEIAAMLENADLGFIGDSIEVPGQITHKRCELRYAPKYLTDAISKAPGTKLKVSYDPNGRSALYIHDDSTQYEAWIAPRSEPKPSDA